ncbi:MAG: glycosyltransferase family 2 protein, partial [Actinomycetota bacterium]
MAIAAGALRPEETSRDSSNPSVLAIVVTHDGRTWLKDALVALAAQDYAHLDVLVVDDASPDSREQPHLKRVAKRHLRRLRWGYLRTPRPLGFGGAINWALSRVRTDADLLLFMHDDFAPDAGSVSAMVERISSDAKTAVVGPKIVSWEDPRQLEEVGMAADRFGYPYKGLEDDEIDLGQHDRSAEVFYVTSTCMLVRHDVFRQLRGWDSRMRAFSEDLDLCWRARLAGHTIRTEPKACGRHAIALATGQRESPFRPARYFIRRNRLRTVFKNASGARLLLLAPQFVLLTIAEMFGFIVLRHPAEILNLGRGMLWNLGNLPQTLNERRKVQRSRTISDKQLERHQVRQSTRIRAYISNQRDRLEETWGRRAELVAQRGVQARRLSGHLRGWIGFAAVLVIISLLLGFRHIWWSPPVAVGELLPYPDRATALWRAFFSPWRGVGLGQAGPTSPALGLLGFFPMLTLGAVDAAQKLLVASLGVLAFTGGYLLVSDLVDRVGRLASGAVYMLGAVGYSGVRQGALGALVFGAVAPFVLRSMVRLCGWSRPPGWNRGISVARIGLVSAISAAFVPGSLLLYLMAAVLLSAARSFFVPGERARRAFASCALGLSIGLVMCLPWASTWLAEGGPLALMRDDATWRGYASSFEGHGMSTVLLGQTPEAPVFFGVALAILGVLAVVISSGQRRRFSLALWSLIVATGV